MSKTTETETINKLQKLASVMNSQENLNSASIETENVEDSNDTKKEKRETINKYEKPKTFKTSEVVGLIIITVIVGLALGGLFGYKIFAGKGELVESELQDFINNYHYIIDNYNGEADEKELLDAALEGMLNKLDKNSVFLDSEAAKNFNIYLEGGYTGVGIEIFNNKDGNITINKVFKNSPASKAGLKSGDIIIKADGKDVKGMEISEFVKTIENKNSKTISLVYIRDGKEYKTSVTKSNIKLQSVKSKIFTQNSKKIGYMQISIFASNTYEQFKEKLEDLEKEGVDSLIIDLRDNSGGYLSTAENIISLFLDSSHPIYQIQKQDQTIKYYSKGKKDTKLKIALLVNSSSASASEILTSSLMEQLGAIVIGEKTYGKGTVQELQNLTSGDKYKLTTKNWLTSKGNWVDQKGISPNIQISLQEQYKENPTEENDNQLQTAIKELSK